MFDLKTGNFTMNGVEVGPLSKPSDFRGDPGLEVTDYGGNRGFARFAEPVVSGGVEARVTLWFGSRLEVSAAVPGGAFEDCGRWVFGQIPGEFFQTKKEGVLFAEFGWGKVLFEPYGDAGDADTGEITFRYKAPRDYAA